MIDQFDKSPRFLIIFTIIPYPTQFTRPNILASNTTRIWRSTTTCHLKLSSLEIVNQNKNQRKQNIQQKSFSFHYQKNQMIDNARSPMLVLHFYLLCNIGYSTQMPNLLNTKHINPTTQTTSQWLHVAMPFNTIALLPSTSHKTF